ncbi:GMC family oxidoreductase [Pseudomonas sp. Pseu.R1]|uniref:GMC family oxidoreductase n=1 Tax=Pseudomonas sp. Pseu.R1 TaxID=3379818 RepID=UPI003B95DD20
MTLQIESTEYLIVGGGAAGCVLANRLSRNPSNNVTLLEAGPDTLPDSTPEDILDTYPGRAMANMDYFWPSLKARRGNGDYLSTAGKNPAFFHQARVIGGGSSINAQIALRGLPRDFDTWAEQGAKGWDWESVLPFFRKLETDVDFENHMHGDTGPVIVRRVPRAKWDPFTQAVGNVWAEQGHAYVKDMNGDASDGFSSVPFSNDGHVRWSAARSYLPNDVRSRPNLRILANTEVTRVRFEGKRAVGVDAQHKGKAISINAEHVILSAGGIHTPKLLMLSGIGPKEHLAEVGIPVVLDKPGVGTNLQDHPSIYASCFMPTDIRTGPHYIGPASYLRYSSGVEGCPESDMVMISAGRSGWHAVGRQLATLVPFIGIPFSRGYVRLKSKEWQQEPDVCFNFLDDIRDRQRMVSAFRMSAELLMHSSLSKVIDNPFPSMFTERVVNLSIPNMKNRAVTKLAASLLDIGSGVRTFLMDHFVNEGPQLIDLLNDEAAMTDYVCNAVVSLWHPSCTCRMGTADDPLAVTDNQGKVFGIDRLIIADASAMPSVPTTNTNLPTLMLAERIADKLLAEKARTARVA